MPLHKIPRVTEHEDLISIQREGERITAIAIDGEYLLVVTDYIGRPYETRATGTGSAHPAAFVPPVPPNKGRPLGKRPAK